MLESENKMEKKSFQEEASIDSNNKLETTIDYSKVAYPPGGVLIWIVIYLELVTFGMAILALAYYGSQERELFHESSMKLNRVIGTINTIFLLTSGLFVALGVHAFKAKNHLLAARWFHFAVWGGFGFLVLKMFEYYQKLEAGLTMDSNSFFTFYWLLTAFHWIHVLVGMVILLIIRRNIVKKKAATLIEDVEAGAAFWHMCDLVWLLLYPMLYLLF
ncbi:MAG: cytochrome c oxidase subunit 3 [Crocinitomicaceae bacterium]|nr:cytochrome c oxidase subunit 3 [Crocinitomicaceae bacterium]